MRSAPSLHVPLALALAVLVGCQAGPRATGRAHTTSVEQHTSYVRGQDLLSRGEPAQALDLLAALEARGLALDAAFLRLRGEARLLLAFERGELESGELLDRAGVVLTQPISPDPSPASRELSSPDECRCSACRAGPARG